MTKAECLTAVKELESLIENFGSPNEPALKRIERLVSLLQDTLTGEYVTEKLDHLRLCAGIGFSVQRFDKHPGGLKGVLSEARESLTAIKRSVRKTPDAT